MNLCASNSSIRPLFTKNFNVKTNTSDNLQANITQKSLNNKKVPGSPRDFDVFSIAQNIYQSKINIFGTKDTIDQGEKIHTNEQVSIKCSVCSTNFTNM